MNYLSAFLFYGLIIIIAYTTWTFYEKYIKISTFDFQSGFLFKEYSKEKLDAIKYANKIL